MKVFLQPIFLLTAVALAAVSHATASTSVEQLEAARALELKAFITTASPVVPGQNVKLVLETATNTWFSGGTKITVPEVAGLIILQNEKFASNASESRKGETWVVQRWTLDIFPQREGSFSIPPIEMYLSVNAGESEDTKESIAGTLLTPATHLEVTLPSSLNDIATWVAAPQFSARQSFDKPVDSLEVGDAFEQIVEFEASDTMAMMLPVYDPERKPGLAVYPSPPVLGNSINRGQNSARRSLRISYIVEAPGIYEIAAKDYFWWDTQEAELRIITLPASSVIAGGAVKDPNMQSREGAAFESKPALRYLAAALGLLLILAILFRVQCRDYFCALVARTLQVVMQLRKPALPDKLNP